MSLPENHFQGVFQSSPDLYLVLSPAFTIVAATDAYLDATFTRREDIIGKHIFSIFPDNPADPSATGVKHLRASLEYILQHRKPHTMAVQQYDIKMPDGNFVKKFWSPLNSPVLDSNNEVKYIIHKVEDVTDFIRIKEDNEAQELAREDLQRRLEEMEADIYKRAQEIQQFNMQLQEQVNEKTSELRAIFERISDGFIALDNNGRFIYANKQAENELGMNAEQLLGKSVWDIFQGEAREPLFHDSLKESMSSGEYKHIEVYSTLYRTWFEAHLYPSASGISVFFRDISRRKKAEEQLKASEYKYKLLFESNPLPMWMLSLPERDFIAVNSAAVQAYGYSKEEFLRMNAKDIRPSEEVSRFLAQMGDPNPGIQHAGVWLHKKKDGTVISADIITHDIYYEGKPARLVLSNDITERLKTEAALRQSEEINRLIMSSSLDAIICMDLEGKINFWNPRAEQIFGWEKEEIIGRLLSDTIVPPRFRDLHTRGLVHYQKTGEGPVLNKLIEISAINKQGVEFPIQLAIIPVKENGNEFFCSFIQDITERKKNELNLKESHEQLRQLASHLQDIREEEQKRIAREVHDELGQQITGLKMDIAWLGKKITGVYGTLPIEEKLREMTALLDAAVQTIRKIASELRPSILDDLGIVAALEWQTREFEKRFGTPVHFQSSISQLQIDPGIATGLFRLYQESLTNVARHAQASHVNAELKIEASQIKLTVNDNGKGFDPNASETQKTLGIIGMKERVLMMNGNLHINSSPGKGTKVTITVPIDEEIAGS
jgi:PAS domain S-box-containing protein